MVRIFALAMALMSSAAFGGPPQRVVSMNLCTDQLALMMAAPGQVISVSKLSQDPYYSMMSDEARKLPGNTGQAEELAFLRPDVVLAGAYTTRVTVEMLQRLGMRVEIFEPENSVADILHNVQRMGRILGQRERAWAMIAEIYKGLQEITPHAAEEQLRGLLYYSGGFTSGSGTLADDILAHAGLKNIAPEMGLGQGGTLSLEAMVLAGPDRILRTPNFASPSRAQEALSHPVLTTLMQAPRGGLHTTPAWSCGTPFTIAAIADLSRAVYAK